MEQNLRQQIISADNDFYRRQAVAFSRTRQNAWSGWEKIPIDHPQSVLDVAGGNGRFYRFLQDQGFNGEYLDVDASPALLATSKLSASQILTLDVLSAYQDQRDWKQKLPRTSYDLVVCFGFIHHIPDPSWRRQFLSDLYFLTAPNGLLAVSFWQFADEKKSLIVQDLGFGDYWLSWGQTKTAARFAHHCSDKEIMMLATNIKEAGAHQMADFRADGRSGQLNRYLVWQKPVWFLGLSRKSHTS